MKKEDNHPWLEMEQVIKNKAKAAKEKWGFSHLRRATELVYDIGEEVYYSLSGAVLKGKILKVLPSGMCWVTMSDSSGENILLNMQKLYKNIRYALMESDYLRTQIEPEVLKCEKK